MRKGLFLSVNSVMIMGELLRRKIDSVLAAWKERPDHKPLIVKGARQIGKTASISAFAQANYRQVIAINFVEQPKFKRIFDDGYEVDTLLKNISLLDPSLRFVPGETLLGSIYGRIFVRPMDYATDGLSRTCAAFFAHFWWFLLFGCWFTCFCGKLRFCCALMFVLRVLV